MSVTRFESSEGSLAFAEIEKLGRYSLDQKRAISDGNLSLYDLPTIRYEFGTVTTETGQEVGVVFGNFHYQTRGLHTPGHPRAFKWTSGWVLAITEGRGKSQKVRPLAYEQDLVELPNTVSRPLVDHIMVHINEIRESQRRNSRAA